MISMDYIIFLNRIVHDRDCGKMQRRYLNELLGHGRPLGSLDTAVRNQSVRWVTGHRKGDMEAVGGQHPNHLKI